MEKVRAFEQVFIRLMRRYKYLEKMHEEEMMKILVSLKVIDPLFTFIVHNNMVNEMVVMQIDSILLYRDLPMMSVFALLRSLHSG